MLYIPSMGGLKLLDDEHSVGSVVGGNLRAKRCPAHAKHMARQTVSPEAYVTILHVHAALSFSHMRLACTTNWNF